MTDTNTHSIPTGKPFEDIPHTGDGSSSLDDAAAPMPNPNTPVPGDVAELRARADAAWQDLQAAISAEKTAAIRVKRAREKHEKADRLALRFELIAEQARRTKALGHD